MSKSLGNYVGIAEPPQEIFGKLMSISDALMWRYIDLLSFESLATIKKWKDEVAGGGNPRNAKVRFAKEIVARFHGPVAAAVAEEEFERIHRRKEASSAMQEKRLKLDGDNIRFDQLLRNAQLVKSAAEAKRLIIGGGVRINGEKAVDPGLELKRGESYVLKVGRLDFIRLILE
jgi:tyrosyl-tRNA synthetase